MLGSEQPGDPSAKESAKKLVKLMLKCRKGPYAYTDQPGKIALEMTDKVVKLKSEDNVGVKVYTYLGYDTCTKKGCGGLTSLFKKCSPYHWSPSVDGPRECKPTDAEKHWAGDVFLNRETAEAAVSRCQQEHVDEFNAKK